MPKPKSRKTVKPDLPIPEQARQLHAAALARGETLTSSAIARQLTERTGEHVSHQRVQQALRKTGAKPGPKPPPLQARIARLRAQLAELEAQAQPAEGAA